MMGRLIAAVSGKGGVGKTMIVAALGAGMASGGKRVVLVDLNTRMRGLDMALGLESRISFDLGDLLEGRCGLDRALITDRRTGVQLIAARQFGDSETLNERTLQIILEVLCLQNDFVILDTSCSLGYSLALALRLAETSMLVTSPDDAALRNAERTAALAKSLARPVPSLVVNRLDAEFVDNGLQYAPEVCAQLLDLPVLGAVPEDRAAMRAMLGKTPVMGDGEAAQAIANLAQRLVEPGIPLRPWRKETVQAVPEAPVATPSPQAAECTPRVAPPPVRRPPDTDIPLEQRGMLSWFRRPADEKQE